MKKRSFIAILILFSYTVGFSHYLIPHCDGGHEESIIHDSKEHGVHFHQHHEEDLLGLDEDHEHYKHADHFDEGIYDLLVCFLSEVEHSDSDFELNNLSSLRLDYTLAKSNKNQVLLAAVYGIFNQYFFIQKKDANEIRSLDLYHSPPILYSPNRGPPAISC